MKTPGTSGFGVAQREKLAEILAEIKDFQFPVSIYDVDAQYVFALTVRDLLIQLQTLATPILPDEIADQLKSINVDEHDFDSASSARAALEALVPAVEDALGSLDRKPDPLLPVSLEQLLKTRKLDTGSIAIKRASRNVETDPQVAVTASRNALESLLKVYMEDRGIAKSKHVKMSRLLKVVVCDIGLDPSGRTDGDVQKVLQGLRSVVLGIAGLSTRAGSAYGHGRHVFELHSRHARLALQASQAFIEFFVEVWNCREERSSSK